MQVKQAANVLELLEYFADRLLPASATDISEALGWPRSSTFNMINTLSDLGYLYEPRSRGGVYPTARWLATAQRIAAVELLPEALLDIVSDLARRTGETTMVSAPAGIFCTIRYVIESKEPIRYFTKEGNQLPIHASASGRAILSQYSLSKRKAIYGKIEFVPYNPQTPTSGDMVERALEDAANRGYQLSDGEFTPHLVGISLPVKIDDRLLSITVAGPQFRCLGLADEFARLIGDRIPTLQK